MTTEKHVFRIIPSPAGAGCYFKVRTLVQTKTGNKIFGGKSDMQSFIIQNCKKLDRFDSGVLATK